jgi:hypothetical protein
MVVGMSICQSSQISTDSELNATFGDATNIGVLPGSPNPSSDRDEKGKLTQSTLSTIVTNLKSSGKIPSSTGYTPEEFIQKQNAMIQSLQLEYCFYESRYKYALRKMFGGIRSGYLNNTDDKKAVVERYLDSTKMLNLRLNDLTQIMNAITEYMLTTSDNIQDEIVKYNKQIQAQKESLDKQNKIINTGDATTNIRKEMVKYTEEKAKYTDNLLKLYSFLNIVTLGLLVYIYKAADNE